MTSHLYLRKAPTDTLVDVRNQFESDPAVTTQISNREVAVDLDAGEIRLGEIVVPSTPEGINALGTWLDVPSAFLDRQDADIKQYLIANLLERKPALGAFVYTPTGLQDVRDPGQRVIPIQRLFEVAERVVAPDARVVEMRHSAEEFRLDLVVPDGHESVGGDLVVGDLSAAGIRIGQDRKHNLAPWVQPFQYRLICTNGMSTVDDGLKVDARGATVEEVMAEFELAADRAFRRVEADMVAFYSLREERITNPERELLRLGTEAGLPVRTITRLQERVPLMAQHLQETLDQDHLTRFDIVNLITNQANDPRLLNRPGARQGLEEVGGRIVSEHTERCSACSSRLLNH